MKTPYEPPLSYALGRKCNISLAVAWEICHQLAQQAMTIQALADRLKISVDACEKRLDRARRVFRAAGITVETEQIEWDAGDWQCSKLCVRDTQWVMKLERLRVRARLAHRRERLAKGP